MYLLIPLAMSLIVLEKKPWEEEIRRRIKNLQTTKLLRSEYLEESRGDVVSLRTQ